MDITAQTITLRDGRKLGFAEWGDLEGTPVFYFTSSEASRYSRHPDETILMDLNIHLYTFDRPGRGISTPHIGRTLADWADDIKDFMQQRKINMVSIIAHSQGSVHALACLYKYPDLIDNLALVSNVAGFDDDMVKVKQSRFFGTQLFLARYLPWLMNIQWNIFRWTLKSERGRKSVIDSMRSWPPADQEVMNAGGGKGIEINFQSLQEGLKQGGHHVTEDFCLTVNDWGFRLNAITQKVSIWHGEADPMFASEMSHYLAKQLPNVETHFIADGGSLLIYQYWHQILEHITGN